MRKPPHVIEIYLQPGEYYFGDRETRIRTVLGSCVSISMWHPRLLIGGMCHYMLPERGGVSPATLDGKYADEAFRLLMLEAARHAAPLDEYEVKLFGGGNMFPSNRRCNSEHIGRKNADFGQRLVNRHGLAWKASDLGGIGHRTVIFDIWSGHVWVRRYSQKVSAGCDSCGERQACNG